MSNPIKTYAIGCEETFHQGKDLPQHRYFTRPIYRTLAPWLGPAGAAAGTFIASEVVLRQIPQAIICQGMQALKQITPETIQGYFTPGTFCPEGPQWDGMITVTWTAIALGVIYAKHIKKQAPE